VEIGREECAGGPAGGLESEGWEDDNLSLWAGVCVSCVLGVG
jgi:hypothetical protein